MRAIILAASLAVVLVTMSRGAAAEKYLIDHEIWGWYQKYLSDTGNGKKPGAFAITKNGRGAYYTWCQDIRCAGGVTYSQDAVNNCERSSGTECVVFAVRDDIKVEYEVVGAPEQSPQSPSDLAPASVTTITITAAVQSDIDTYLRNADQGGRVWALAIAKDGSTVESASCRILGSYAGGGPCSHVAGSMQDLANREAIKRCGGTDECLLLYAGKKKVASINIVAE